MKDLQILYLVSDRHDVLAGIVLYTVAQNCHGNFNLFKAISIILTAISIILTAISICSRQFQFAHGNFNLLTAISTCSDNFSLLTAISIYSRQFQLVHGNFNLLSAISICSRQFHFLTANNAHGIFRFAHHVKTQNQKSIFKVDLQSEK